VSAFRRYFSVAAWQAENYSQVGIAFAAESVRTPLRIIRPRTSYPPEAFDKEQAGFHAWVNGFGAAWHKLTVGA
jgi:hypothetical protein